MHNLSQSNKRRIIKDVIIGARLYEKYLLPYEFLVITEDGKSVVICFHKKDFAHLADVRNVFNDIDFYHHCIHGTLTEKILIRINIMILELFVRR
ncbi:MAG: PBECR4 domain-containing protein [Erysipelotrichaceae bacterium]|nr:PBECR4 domain-containing protein [Erysipelotrichaceae bacterium]